MEAHTARRPKTKMHNESTARFGAFEINLRTGELRKSGVRVRLQEQPFQVLAALLERPGELVTREDLQARLWPDSQAGDFEQGLNKAVNKLRTALSDSADNPRFVETLSRRGYRFLAPVEFRHTGREPASAEAPAIPVARIPGDEAAAPIPPETAVASGESAFPHPSAVAHAASPLWENPESTHAKRSDSWSPWRVAAVVVGWFGLFATLVVVSFVVWVVWPGTKRNVPLPPGAAGSEGEVIAWSPTEQRLVPIEPAVSADGVTFTRGGEWVAFVSFPSAKLWTMRSNGDDLREIVPGVFDRTYVPAWSPDGERVAFAAQKPDGPWKVYVVNRDGTDLREVNPGPGTESDPTWSPDGKTLALAPFPWDTSATGIYLVDVDSGAFRMLEGSRGWFSPRWSPDGRSIAALQAEGSQLGIFDLERKVWREITDNSAIHPIWNRDGSALYFIAEGSVERYLPGNGRTEPVISVSGMSLLSNSPFGRSAAPWVGLTAEGQPMLLRSKQE